MIMALKLGTYEGEKNGNKIKYSIETITEENAAEVIDHLIKHFLTREPIFSYIGVKDDPVCLTSLKALWKYGIDSGTSIVALLEESGNRKVIGANMTYIQEQNPTKSIKIEGSALKTTVEAFVNIAKQAKFYERYKVDRYLNANGLSVDPAYEGYQVGFRLLQSREKICRHFGVNLTATTFTAAASQHLADRLGFETHLECNYSDFELNGEKIYEFINERFNEPKMKAMAKYFEL